MAGQVGFKSETTYGTGVVVDKFVEVLDAGLTIDQGYLRRAGIRAGRRTRRPGTVGALSVGASLNLELPNVTLATLLKHMLGTINTTGAGPYEHTASPGPQTGTTKSMTVQVGVADAAGTVQPFTLTGAKVNSWELSCTVGEYARLGLELSAQNATTGTALATASYASGLDPFTFIQGSVTVDGNVVASARAVTLSANKGLRVDRHALGSRLIREQLEQDPWEITGSITCDFENLDMVALMFSADEVAVVLDFDNATDSLVITTNAQITGDPPNLSTFGLEEQTVNFEVGSDTSDAASITAVLTNADSSAA